MQVWAALDEAQLIARAKSGQVAAYGELVQRNQARVYSAVRRVVGNEQDALDLTQEAFVRAHAALDGFECERPFAPWITRVAVNLALNWLQRRRLPTSRSTMIRPAWGRCARRRIMRLIPSGSCWTTNGARRFRRRSPPCRPITER
ncbi:MAG: sigma-70 family RNA polymerase sigma factor [Oscillochloris sp.]|nr:sigma-70 family RNA polymerase sigma factor [Oscillochloris sp.]